MLNGGYETISPSDNGLNVVRLIRIIVESLPEFPNRSIDAVVGVEKDVLTPNPLNNLFTCNKLRASLDEEQEQFHGNAPQLNGLTATP